MRGALGQLGDITGGLGIFLCAVSVAGRFWGTPRLFSYEAIDVFTAGTGLIALGCFLKLQSAFKNPYHLAGKIAGVAGAVLCVFAVCAYFAGLNLKYNFYFELKSFFIVGFGLVLLGCFTEVLFSGQKSQ